MGIKHFFTWFRKNFGKHIKSIERAQKLNVTIDNLMIDMNGIFHNSAQKIYQYGNCKPRSRFLNQTTINPLSPSELQVKVFEDVCLVIENIISVANPLKRVLLCIDGPAPLSKQNQQRQRRFRSSMESGENSIFNSNCITPGTKFMDELSKYIESYICKRILEDDSWKRFEVIFSNEKVPGEGEHKLINFIRKNANTDETYCICGMDADLIMLSLGTHMPKFYILREDTRDPAFSFLLIDVGKIRSELSDKMKWVEIKYKFSENRAINDFIFLCFMVGNDFLPHIPSIEIIEKGLELIIEVYKETCSFYGHITERLDGKVRFRRRPLCVFLDTIGKYEKENLENKLNSRNSFFPDEILNRASKQNMNGKWEVNVDMYKNEYMERLFPKNIDIKKICHDYLAGMQWVLSYYTMGVPNWKWYFPYHYAPPASVIAMYTESFKFPVYQPSSPNTPFQQLLCVLPPKSANLIPPPLSELLTNKDSELKKFCPDTFNIDISGKRQEWEGIVILPMIDFEMVKNCYEKLIHLVNSKDLERNIFGNSIKYTYLNGSVLNENIVL